MAFLNGQMVENIVEIGQKESRMMKEKYMILLKINGLQVNGIWEEK